MICTKSFNSPAVDKKEVLRYAGTVGDSATLTLLDSCIAEAESLLSYKVCFARFPISISDETIDLGFAKVRSHSLAICLDGCHEIILMAATVGFGIDRLIEKHGLLTPSRAVMLQALGSERVEALCDEFCRDLAAEEDAKGNVIRPRFSPGYGDLSLEVQRKIFEVLDCTRNLGINLNDNLFMTPTKSVTAIIGIKGKKDENS